MRTGRSYVATAVALGIITLGGCAADSADQQNLPPEGSDWGDPEKHPEVGGAYNQLTAVDGTCTWNATTGAFVMTLTDVAQTAVLGVRAIDSQLTVNGKICSSTAGATSKLVKTVDIKIAAAGEVAAQAVVLDFLNGVFAPGVATGPGFTVNLGAGSAVDTLAVRGSSKADTIVVGAPASGVTPIAFNADAFADITVKDAVSDKMSFSLAGDKDTFTAQGGTGYAGTYTGPVTVFGGGAVDTIYGGSGNDSLYGGGDADVINGGLGNDMLYGDDGDDVFNTIATPDGQDTMNCGTGADKVSYELRTAAISVTLGTPDNLGDDNAVGGTGGDADMPVPNDGDISGSGEKDHVLSGCESVVGGTGNDVLIGDENDNVLTGGNGNDVLQGMLGKDTFNGGAGVDTVDYSEKTAAIKVTMTAATPEVADDGETASPSGGEKDNVKADVENLKGGAGADELIGNDFANEIWPGDGNDKVQGGKGDDIFHEGAAFTAGVDGILGGSGGTADDDVAAPNGSDSIDGGEGVDTIDYSERRLPLLITLDYISTATPVVHQSGNDGTATTAGTPMVWTAVENDNIWKTVEVVLGGSGDDSITGDTSAPVSPAVGINNEIEGNGGNDKINGGYGDDIITGGAGDDNLSGGAGDDQIEGSGGTNVIDCGDDSDIAYSGTEPTPGTVTCELLF